ncbi:MAG: acyl-CoA desaturase, partial [Ekhidna sp.]
MTFIDKVLKVPSYGWKDTRGELIIPSKKQLFKEFFSRINIFKNRKNWISGISWVMVVCMLPFFYFFIFHFFSLGLLA